VAVIVEAYKDMKILKQGLLAFREGFIFADEIFTAYDFKSTHRQLFAMEVLCLPALYFLPERELRQVIGG
jgi:hypothetical protein